MGGFLGSAPDPDQGSGLCRALLSLPWHVPWEHPGVSCGCPKAVTWTAVQPTCPELSLPLRAAATQTLGGQLCLLKKVGVSIRGASGLCIIITVLSSFSFFPCSFVHLSPAMQNVFLPEIQEPREPASCGEGGPEINAVYS